ncbi:uncharacterized protein LOC133867946 [Alnus glutinosa]|uniref:uncharacterized protein LOC133867946 n=1 Tax=Alnus glutinosa TaxID=3517 RepID=UPI002D771E03|nr:uncharacterized protein LOC133867946 [Alnus glutinosa]
MHRKNRVFLLSLRVTGSGSGPRGFGSSDGFLYTGHGSPETAAEPPDMEDRTSGRFGFGSRVHEPPGFSLSGLTGCGSRASRSELLGSTDCRRWLCRRRPSTTHREPDLWAVRFPSCPVGSPTHGSTGSSLSQSLASGRTRTKRKRRRKKNRRKRREKRCGPVIIKERFSGCSG